MNELFYDRENKKFYVKELDSVNNVVTDEQYVDVTDEIVTLIQEHVTKDGKKVICLDTTFTVEQEQSFKSFCPQLKQEQQIKEGDKVSIHCRKDREEGIIAIYDGKVGEVIHVGDKRYPWGHIIVKLDNDCNNSFHEDELEVLDEPPMEA